MKTIKVSYNKCKYGFEHLYYKDGRKIVVDITFPNCWNNYVYRASYGRACFDNKDLNKLKSNVESCLNNMYFEPVNIVYL